ncbi:MAG: hypothetical protein ACYTFA_15715, partial [Planctomycetota bacterium]
MCKSLLRTVWLPAAVVVASGMILCAAPSAAYAGVFMRTVQQGNDDGHSYCYCIIWCIKAQDLAQTWIEIGPHYVSECGPPEFQRGAFRFSSVIIPQGAHIKEATLSLYHKDGCGSMYGILNADDVDNSKPLPEEPIWERSLTAAGEDWNFDGGEGCYQTVDSPDTRDVIQEVINRPGWRSGNTITILYSPKASPTGTFRRFASFEDGRRPTLQIVYDTCGDEVCDQDETCQTCAADCHRCGDGCCDPGHGENACSCGSDCPGCCYDSDCPDDGDPCTDRRCQDYQCRQVPNSEPCDDGVYCNGPDRCSDGGCNYHSGDPCQSSCTAPGINDNDCIGCCNESTNACSRPEPNGSPCDDGLYCNGTDTCNSSGSCANHSGNPCDCNTP